jgi:uncharacterized membrane protein YdjX (TVP38/TMEM64 family)
VNPFVLAPFKPVFMIPILAHADRIVAIWSPQLWLTEILAGIHSLGVIAPIVFAGIYILATVAFLPGSVLTLGAGVVFGVVWGSVYVFVAATLGAIAAFLVGRYLARDWVAAKIADNPKFAAIDAAVGREGLKIVLLTRLSPIFPFNLLNYAYGVTGVRLRDYAIGSIGMLPGTIMYVYIGSLAGSLATIGTDIGGDPQAAIAKRLIKIVGLIATIAVTLYITKIARQALDATVDPPVSK